MRTPWLLLSLSLAVPACSDAPITAPLSRIDLRAATSQADAHPVGVAVAAGGARVVLDETAGLYQIAADGTTTRLRALEALPTPDVPIRPPFTDVVALGADRFALTAIGDGYLLDLGADTMRQYFCYEPGGFPDDEEQRTAAVAYDASADRLYAQPRTFDADGQLLRSELSAYDVATGADVSWRALPLDFTAGGMAAVGDGTLVLGAGSRLYRYDVASFTLTAVDDLARFGVSSIGGLALGADTVVVIDDGSDALVEVAQADVGL